MLKFYVEKPLLLLYNSKIKLIKNFISAKFVKIGKEKTMTKAKNTEQIQSKSKKIATENSKKNAKTTIITAKNTNVVKYDNKLNLIALKSFSKADNSIFFALLSKLQNQETKEVLIDSAELKRLIDAPNLSNKILVQIVNELSDKIIRCIVRYETEDEVELFTLFQRLSFTKNNTKLRAQISEPFAYLINKVKYGFTMLEVYEFSRLRSKYSQVLYRLLKQFRFTGILSLEWSKFIEIMDIPIKLSMKDIEKSILKPVINELANLISKDNTLPFQNLTYEKTKTPGQGNKITGITFKFVAETEKDKRKKYNDNNKNNDNDKSKTKIKFLTNKNIDTNADNINNSNNDVAAKLQCYIGTPIKFMIKNENATSYSSSVCKIHSITFGIGEGFEMVIKVRLKNSDDGYVSDFYEFKSERHFLDWLKKNKV